VPALDEVRRLIARRAGISPPDWALRARVEERMLATAAPSVEAYSARLESDGRELETLCEALRVGETRFFRHRAHVAALRERIIPALAGRRAGARAISAWSAGCATGEEAFTLAMLLCEGLPAGFAVRVLASDLSATALERARTGRYPAAALAEVPPALAERWLVAEGSAFQVRDELRELVEFEQRSLTAPAFPRDVDLILCRNVLIYFERGERERALDRLCQSLAPGGYLLLGYAEVLRGREAIVESLHSPDGVVYMKREAARPQAGRAPAVAPPAASPPRTVAARPVAMPPRELPRDEPPATSPATVRLDGVIADEKTAADRLRAVVGQPALVLLDGADFLCDEAAAVVRRAAAAARVVLVASRPGVLRWIGRTGLGDVVRIVPDVQTGERELAGR
jgi:chemotaxis protein methyltransferase CheR